MCHESSGEALSEVIGIGKGCVTLHDLEHTDAIFIIGQNPGTNHPRMLSSLQRAKAARREDRLDQSDAGGRQFPFQESAGPEEPAAPGGFPPRERNRAKRSLAAGPDQWRRRSAEGDHEGNAGRRGTESRHGLRSRFHPRLHRLDSTSSSPICARRAGTTSWSAVASLANRSAPRPRSR